MTTPNPIATNRVTDLVGRFADQKLLVIGDVVLDRYVFGKVERLNPEAPVPVLHAKKEASATGGAGNTAKNAAMLGATTTLISVVGNDQTASEIKAAAEREGYRAVLIQDPSRPSIEKKRYLVGSQQMLRVDYEETHNVEGAVEDQLIAAINEHAQQATGILVSDYAKGVVTEKVAQAIMAAANQQNIPVMADVKPSHIPFFTGVTYISPNRKEAHEYLGLNQHIQGGRSKEELAAMLFDSFKTNVFLTLSEEGMFLLTSEVSGVHVPQVHVIEVADPSGCGDTAAVGLLLAKLVGGTDIEAAQLANAAAAVVAQKTGSVGLTPAELVDMITHHHETPVSENAVDEA